VERDERVAQERLAQPTPVLEQAAGEKEPRANVAPFHPDPRVAAIAVLFVIGSVALAFPESEVSRETKIVMAETSSAAGGSSQASALPRQRRRRRTRPVAFDEAGKPPTLILCEPVSRSAHTVLFGRSPEEGSLRATFCDR
jgi:hypothetical protein